VSNSDQALPSRRRVLKGIAKCAVGAAAPNVLAIRSALAAYPDRPVRIVVPNSPGGPSDIIGRLLATRLQQAMGGSFIVENRGGGGGNIGMGAVARSEADGYTLLITTSAYAVNPGLYKTLPYDPIKDFVPIAEIATTPNVFTVKKELGVKSLRELVDKVKTNPNKFNVSTPPIGTTPQLLIEILKVREGLGGMATVVFTGGGLALKALLENTVQISCGALAPAHPQIKAGTVVGLATSGAKRWHDLPDMPTMSEAGFRDYIFENYVGLVAPSKTPAEMISGLEKAVLDILSDPEVRALLVKSGFQVEARGGKAHMERIVREVPMYRDIITQAGIARI
jgi:tripartite-type tricarboxylate transporter receptor subunit TctC